jgi:hypothetical protein
MMVYRMKYKVKYRCSSSMGLNQPLVGFVLILHNKECSFKACTAFLRPIFERASTSKMKIVSNGKSKIDTLTLQ